MFRRSEFWMALGGAAIKAMCALGWLPQGAEQTLVPIGVYVVGRLIHHGVTPKVGV